MKHAFYILTFITLIGCMTETYNKIPCEYDLTALHDSLEKYGLSSYGEGPDGFVWKQKYDSTKVDCGNWTITLGIDSCNNIFFDENYVLSLAEIIFSDPKNTHIHTVMFELGQCHYKQGQRKLDYEIIKDKMPSIEVGKLYETKNAKIIKQVSEGYSGKPENKIVTLLVDSLPTDPYSLAIEFASKNKQYRQIELVIENINSQICKRVEYIYGFEN